MSDPAPNDEARAQKSRAFLINVMMTFFISVSVFVVGTYFFVIPYLFNHAQQLQEVRAWAVQHQALHEAGPEEEPAPEAVPAGGPEAAAPEAAPAAPEAPKAEAPATP
jgi:hypothetical protein